MAVIDLTLESFWIPAIPNYDTYRFGTKKQSGGLSTQEVNDNIMMPWERARPIEITDISTTKASGDTKAPVQADCSFVFTAGQRVSFTLDNADYVGCRATFYNTSAYIQDVRTLNSTDPNSPSYDTHTVLEGGRIVLVWNGTAWQNISPTDTVAMDNMNPVTSHAVAEAISPIAMPINVMDKVTLSSSHYKCIYAVYYETETEWFFDIKYRGDGADDNTTTTVDLSAFLTSTATIAGKNFLIFNGGSTNNVSFSNESLTNGVLSFYADTNRGGSSKSRWCEYIYWGNKA